MFPWKHGRNDLQNRISEFHQQMIDDVFRSAPRRSTRISYDPSELHRANVCSSTFASPRENQTRIRCCILRFHVADRLEISRVSDDFREFFQLLELIEFRVGLSFSRTVVLIVGVLSIQVNPDRLLDLGTYARDRYTIGNCFSRGSKWLDGC